MGSAFSRDHIIQQSLKEDFDVILSKIGQSSFQEKYESFKKTLEDYKPKKFLYVTYTNKLKDVKDIHDKILQINFSTLEIHNDLETVCSKNRVHKMIKTSQNHLNHLPLLMKNELLCLESIELLKILEVRSHDNLHRLYLVQLVLIESQLGDIEANLSRKKLYNQDEDILNHNLKFLKALQVRDLSLLKKCKELLVVFNDLKLKEVAEENLIEIGENSLEITEENVSVNFDDDNVSFVNKKQE